MISRIDRLSWLGVVTGERRNVLQPILGSDGSVTFQVYPPSRCQSVSVVPSSPAELIAVATRRPELMQQIEATEDLLKRHATLLCRLPSVPDRGPVGPGGILALSLD